MNYFKNLNNTQIRSNIFYGSDHIILCKKRLLQITFAFQFTFIAV